jgi:hypothetical protein
MNARKVEKIGLMKRGAQREPNCQIRLDRLVVGVPDKPSGGLPQPKGFKRVGDTLVRPQGAIATYGRVRRFVSKSSSCKISIQYDRQAPWLPWCRITLIGDDWTGLTLEEIESALAEVPDHRISLVELAFDFLPGTQVDEEFVLRHGKFGKSRRRTDRGGPGTLRYGSRGSPKLVRCYRKAKLDRYRVELEIHTPLLRKWSIRKITELPLITTKLWPTHICFTGMRWEKLESHLVRRYGTGDGRRLSEGARERARVSLRKVTRFLSRSVHNPHRFLGSAVTNRHIREALQRWAVRFGLDEGFFADTE